MLWQLDYSEEYGTRGAEMKQKYDYSSQTIFSFFHGATPFSDLNPKGSLGY